MALYLQTVLLLSFALRCWAEGYGDYGGHGGAVCSNDGFYFNDDTSVTACSNGNAYLMRCAPGSQNQAGRHFSKSYSDFCTVNLNDYGYGASKYGSQSSFSSSHGHGGYQKPSYKPPMPSYKPPPKPHYGPEPLKPRQHYPAVKVPIYMSKY